LASQQKLGLRAEWRAGFGGFDSDHPAADGTHLIHNFEIATPVDVELLAWR
jgi:hypothetical protein